MFSWFFLSSIAIQYKHEDPCSMIISTVVSEAPNGIFLFCYLKNSVFHENYFTFLQAVLWMAVKHQDKVKNTKSRLFFSSSKTIFIFR